MRLTNPLVGLHVYKPIFSHKMQKGAVQRLRVNASATESALFLTNSLEVSIEEVLDGSKGVKDPRQSETNENGQICYLSIPDFEHRRSEFLTARQSEPCTPLCRKNKIWLFFYPPVFFGAVRLQPFHAAVFFTAS